MQKKLKKFLALLIAMLCASELAVRIFSPVTQTKQVSSPHMYEDHPSLGFRLRNNLVTRVHGMDGNRKIFDVKYRTDQFGRRIVPLDKPELRQKHFIILGGSTVFGMGLPDHETLAFQLASKAFRVIPFNYAVDGYGPQSAYTQVKLNLLKSEIEQEEGTTAFFFQMRSQAGGHAQTLLGTFSLLLDGWGEGLSFYEIDPSSTREPKYLGKMKDFDPLKFYSFRFFQNFHLINTLHPKLFPLTELQLTQTASFFNDLKKQVLESKPKTRFVVIFHPLSDRTKIEPLKKLLEAKNIEAIDYSQLIDKRDLPGHTAFNRYFPHPNGKLNSLLAAQLIEDLKLDR